MANSSHPFGFQLTAPGLPLRRVEISGLDPGCDEVVVEVAGCGVCHTDVAFAAQGVPTRHPLPLILGHEISGRVAAVGKGSEEWLNRAVIVPAVIPCGECPACSADRPTICRRQFMPGNDGNGGFATHVKVPARGLCPVPVDLPAGLTLRALSVIADGVSTPYEAIDRSRLTDEHVAIIVGAGGIGGFGVQIAAAMGAAVVAVDISRPRLLLAEKHGAGLVLDARKMDTKAIKGEVRAFAKASGRRGIGYKIFETSGTTAGQKTAFALLNHGAHLAVVGFTPESVDLRFSNLMAFDATAQGNWGCPPEQYSAVLDMVLDGRVKLQPFIEEHSLEQAPRVLQALAEHQLKRRAVLVPPDA